MSWFFLSRNAYLIFIQAKVKSILYVSKFYFLNLPIKRPASPTQRTSEVEPIMIPQSFQDKGTTLNISPPNVTIRYCPTMISKATIKKLLHPFRLANAERPSMNAFALNMFQNWSITKKLKNQDRSCGVSPSCAWK